MTTRNILVGETQQGSRFVFELGYDEGSDKFARDLTKSGVEGYDLFIHDGTAQGRWTLDNIPDWARVLAEKAIRDADSRRANLAKPIREAVGILEADYPEVPADVNKHAYLLGVLESQVRHAVIVLGQVLKGMGGGER